MRIDCPGLLESGKKYDEKQRESPYPPISIVKIIVHTVKGDDSKQNDKGQATDKDVDTLGEKQFVVVNASPVQTLGSKSNAMSNQLNIPFLVTWIDDDYMDLYLHSPFNILNILENTCTPTIFMNASMYLSWHYTTSLRLKCIRYNLIRFMPWRIMHIDFDKPPPLPPEGSLWCEDEFRKCEKNNKYVLVDQVVTNSNFSREFTYGMMHGICRKGQVIGSCVFLQKVFEPNVVMFSLLIMNYLAVCHGGLYNESWEIIILLWSWDDYNLVIISGDAMLEGGISALFLHVHGNVFVVCLENEGIMIWKNDMLMRGLYVHKRFEWDIFNLYKGIRVKDINADEKDGTSFILIYCTIGFSDGHINPVVTFEQLLVRKMLLPLATGSMVAQSLTRVNPDKAFLMHQYSLQSGGC